MKGCRPFTNEEVKAIFENGFTGRYANRDKAIFALGIVGGYRISEILSLDVGDVWRHKMVTNYVYVRRGNVKKKAQGRSIKMTEQTREILRAWIKDVHDYFPRVTASTKLFVSQELFPRAISNRRAAQILKSATKRVGIVEPDGINGTHSMRKTFAERRYDYYVEQYRAGNITREPILMLQRDLGHTSVDNTLKYISFKSNDFPDHLNNLY